MLRKLSFNTVLLKHLFALLFIVLVASCTNSKKTAYFQGAGKGNIASNTPIPESVIQPSDILNITVSSLSLEASEMFNPQKAEVPGANAMPGYLVNSDGYIQFPQLGNIKVEGLTKNQLKDKIVNGILEKKLLLDPIVSIRFTNFRVTVLGEVNRPSVVPVPGEKISLLEAIGLAGDLTIYGKRENVMIIREEKEQKIITRIDMNSTELLTSPYYYLRSNDIVYVEPNKAKIASSSRSNQWLPMLFSGLSFLAIVADRVIK
jgi:polysaccharide biosynthesis/export protein